MIPQGKLPADLLAELLGRAPADPSVVVGPGVGLDAAVIDAGGDELIVAAADPITFVASQPARYALRVNANDIAVMGARPRWFLATVLLPPGIGVDDVTRLFAELTEACHELDVALVGGHSEVTDAVSRAVIAGTMLGTVVREAQVSAAGARPGDEIWLAGSVVVEGTAILCREARDQLLAAGVSAEVIAGGSRLLDDPGISVVEPALAAVATKTVSAMHDPTEGGISGALYELAAASDCSLTIDAAAIPVLEETRIVCAALDLEPLGLLASGALLMAVRPDGITRLSAALRKAGVAHTRIGVAGEGAGVTLRNAAGEHPLSPFQRDELARFLEALPQAGGR
jgi:hydrogenase expression/formation protein HypE